MIIAVGGGKGGTGKTVIAVNLAVYLANRNHKVALVDLDVDNPCTYTLLKADLRIVSHVYSFKPKIIEDKCSLCGKCVENCPLHALVLIPGKKLLFIETLCEGCGNCIIVCPQQAIVEGRSLLGKIMAGEYNNLKLVVGELKPGERKSDEVIDATLNYILKVFNNYDYIILDIPPGTGRGVYQAFKPADLIVAVTEPTMLGLHDLIKLSKLIYSMKKKWIAVINKYGLPGGIYSKLKAFLEDKGVKYLLVPYDLNLVKAYMNGKTVIMEYPETESSKAIINLGEKIEKGEF